MRSTLLGLLAACGLLAATVVPGLACPYNTQASSDSQAQQQTAELQRTSTTTAQ